MPPVRKPAAPAASPSTPAGHATGQPRPWAKWLAECQQRFGNAPREFDAETTKYISMTAGWMYALMFFIPICKLLKNSRQRSIFRLGQVVWGHIIQANGALWSPSETAGPGNEEADDAPGELVFSLDVAGRVTPDYLEPIAENLAALRTQGPVDAELKPIADYLEAETVRVFGWNVPQRFTPHVPCYISTTMFLRKHLPDGYLHRAFLPIVISHEPPYFAMPLPARFWSPELLTWWTSE